jgi:hypothetical protein
VVRHVAATLTIAFASSLIFYFCVRPEPVRADAEQYRVFSDYLTAGLTGESHSLGSREGIVVILGKTTSGLGMSRFLIGSFRHVRRNSPLSSFEPLANLLFSNHHSKQLQRSFDIPTSDAVMTGSEAALYPYEAFYRRFPNNYGYHTFSQAGFNREMTQVIFYIEHMCGLCGEGKYVYMRKINGKWILAGQAITWVS